MVLMEILQIREGVTAPDDNTVSAGTVVENTAHG